MPLESKYALNLFSFFFWTSDHTVITLSYVTLVYVCTISIHTVEIMLKKY